MIRLFTDSDTDMTLEDCKKYGYTLISMPYIVDGQIVYPYRDFETFDAHAFYDSLRQGTMPTTCAINAEEYKAYFEPVFAANDDIFYVHFSSAMSRTFESMQEAVAELKEKYPQRKFYTVDTKFITIGANLVVKEIGEMFANGASAEDVLAWAEKEVDHFACYFFADSLKFFAKSGRVSGIAATMGSILGIKPIIYMNADGQMVNLTKEMGRTKAIKRLVAYVESLQNDIKNHKIVIGHTDSLANAQHLDKLLKEKFGEDLQTEIIDVNPTAGSHCGPDTVGVAFYSIHR